MSKIPYIYILSQRYSGSTLLSFLLGTHPDITTIGERRKFSTFSFPKPGQQIQPCSCGKPFNECDHWTAIKERVSKRVDVSAYSTNATEFHLFENKYVNRLAVNAAMPSLLAGAGGKPFRGSVNRLLEFNRVLVEEALALDGGKAFLDSSKGIEHTTFLSQIPEFDFKIIWLTRDPRAQANSAMKYNPWNAEQAANEWKKEMVANQSVLRR